MPFVGCSGSFSIGWGQDGHLSEGYVPGMTLIMGIVAVLGMVHPAEDPGFELGLTLRIWDVGRPMDFLAEIAPDQTPNVDRRVDEVNFTHATDFGSPPDYFVVELSGLINITKPGDYILIVQRRWFAA